jgi:hypothetical protein
MPRAQIDVIASVGVGKRGRLNFAAMSGTGALVGLLKTP